METTVYIEQEKITLVSDPEAWQAKVKELGLAGQESLYTPDTKANPFLRMDAGLVRVFEALCPTKTEIEKFDAEPIPLDALGAYGLAVHEGYFGKVEIWYRPGQPDPVMVGTAGSEHYLMAQWGPEKITLDQAKTRARQRWTERARAGLESQIAEAQKNLQCLDALATKHFAGDWTGVYA